MTVPPVASATVRIVRYNSIPPPMVLQHKLMDDRWNVSTQSAENPAMNPATLARKPVSISIPENYFKVTTTDPILPNRRLEMCAPG